MGYDDIKEFEGRKYTGMSVGGSHDWNYPDGSWHETKVAPDKWLFEFRATKNRRRAAPRDTGAKRGTGYHWYILADQNVRKVDKDSYDTLMRGLKFKIGHRRPKWKHWSYQYPEQAGYHEKLISILKDTIEELKGRRAES